MQNLGYLGITQPAGGLGLKVIRGRKGYQATTVAELLHRIKNGLPFGVDDPQIRAWRYRNLPNLYRGFKTVLLASGLKLPCFWGELDLVKILGTRGRLADLLLADRILNFGLASLRVVTTAGVNAIVDAFQNTVELETFKYHGLGTGTGAEAVGDTALGTELTTEYTGNVRATGTTAEGGSANIYQSVATNTLDSGTPAITEHGIFTQAATGGGTLLDRTKFSAINLDGTAGDSLQSTYSLTFSAGG